MPRHSEGKSTMPDHATEWEAAKTAYFNLTGEKKPKEVFVKFFTTSHTKLSGTIKKCDKLAVEGVVTEKKASPKAFAARAMLATIHKSPFTIHAS